MIKVRKLISAVFMLACIVLASTPVAADMKGVDVSSWQSNINIKNLDADFVVVKATEGTAYVSPVYRKQANDTIRSGKKLGLYHYMSYNASPKKQAEHFYNNVKNYVGTAVMVLDFEGSAVNNGVTFALEFLREFEALSGVKAMIYMSQSVTTSLNWNTVVKENYGLWVAQYPLGNALTGYTDSLSYSSTGAWGFAAMHQYTSTGRVFGYSGNLDLNRFYGNEGQWDAYAKSTKATADHGTQNTQTYTVKSGDCLSVIGANVGVSWTSIANANGIYSPYTIYPGQVLKIPAGDNPRTYTVKSGDCLSVIGAKVGVSWTSIANANGIYSPYTIYPGQVLKIA